MYDYDSCDASYGSYDSNSKKLTLGSGVNGLPNGYVAVNVDDVTISANSDIRSSIYATSNEVTLDFGNYSFIDVPHKSSDTSASYSMSDLGNGLVIESGTFNFSKISEYGPLEINGGH